MSQLKNYREVGIFDLLSAPLNPIGAFDAEQFKIDAQVLLDQGSKHVAVDLTGLDFLYSDAYNAFMQFQQALSRVDGSLGILTDNKIIIDGLHRAGLDRSVHVFREEAALMGYSIKENAAEAKYESASVPVNSENASVAELEMAGGSTRKRTTGRFTKSFNAICEDPTIVRSVGGCRLRFWKMNPVLACGPGFFWSF
jgi:anti-anti-sigma regulatory factor